MAKKHQRNAQHPWPNQNNMKISPLSSQNYYYQENNTNASKDGNGK
jgi:hypothetical protein